MENIDITVEEKVIEIHVDGGRGPQGVPGSIPIVNIAQRNVLTPTDGMEIYCTDAIASNGQLGTKQQYQLSTNSWRTFVTI